LGGLVAEAGGQGQVTATKESRVSGVTFDAGGLIALDRGDRRVIVLLARAHELGQTVTVPAAALAQAVRHPRTQTRLSRLIRQPSTAIVALDGPDATKVGVLLAATKTRDIVDAHVVLCARRSRQPIVTSDPDDLRRLDPDAELVVI
jgi:hypothetical protein